MKIIAMKSMEIEQINDLVMLARQGDKEAFVQLIQENKISLYRVAKGILQNEADVEDVIQITILKAYEHIRKLKVSEYFKTWITRILINECTTVLRGRKRVVSMESNVNDLATIEDTYTNVNLYHVVHSLREKLRIVTILFYYEDLSTKEIANLLALPEGTVRSRLSKARLQLQKKLNKEEKVGE
ncbi:sigma-70 family RNA polymerase sigma factor [Niallia sp. JL1B1071]|uniref:sigma-70 family RNA polymerase sigma factor n=1 Tax=Niallia tiangongensis TaxID=3237105 RepID=UPI0037DC84AE